MKPRLLHALSLLTISLAACGDDNPPPPPADTSKCSVKDQTGCETGQVCEDVQGGTVGCFKPVSLQGMVIDALDKKPISGARVVARDANDAAVSTVAVSGVDGVYKLTVPAKRDSAGKAVAANLTLRADASGYLTFPKAPRSAIPVDVSAATGEPLIVKNAATDIALIPIEGTALGWVSGKIEAPTPGGTLVVAGGSTGVADRDGTYTVFNVPAGSVQVSAYATGLQISPETASVTAGAETKDVNLKVIDGKAAATISGSVQIVNAPGGSTTSVVLAVEETFQASVARGEAPPGLRAANVSGSFSIPGVPDGKYVVLAAFENDNLVRDPDTSIGGTELVHITVTGADQAISQGFKVTGALAVISPGASKIDEVSGTPTFEWADDSSEDSYDVQLFDALGNEVWKKAGVTESKGNKNVSVAYDGAALEPGMFYQFRVVSIKDGTPISATEDLKGVFVYK